MAKKLPHVADVPNAVVEWLDKKHLMHDTHLYTPEEWRARGEKYGQGSLFTITTEGSLNHLINYPESARDVKLLEQFNTFLAKLGVYYEQGYAWSLHFYPTH